MRNVLGEKPSEDLHGRLKFSVDYVQDADIRNRSVLEIGCGFGWFSLAALNCGVKEIRGIEPSNKDIATAEQHVRDPRANFVVASALDLPFGDSSFDTIVCWEVLEHLPRNTEQQLFAEASRVLRRGGKFYLSTPYRSLPSTLLDPAYFLIAHRHYRHETVADLARSAGFTIEDLRVRGRWYEVLGWWNLYVSKWIFRRGPFLRRIMDLKLDKEYERDDGFALLFTRLTCDRDDPSPVTSNGAA